MIEGSTVAKKGNRQNVIIRLETTAVALGSKNNQLIGEKNLVKLPQNCSFGVMRILFRSVRYNVTLTLDVRHKLMLILDVRYNLIVTLDVGYKILLTVTLESLDVRYNVMLTLM